MKPKGVLLALFFASGTCAAEGDWRHLQAERFVVISQLNDKDTRRWAVELDQYIDALHELYGINGLALPPLTMVLFARPKDFAPYRAQTSVGQANIAGFFSNQGTWSVIGMAGRGGNVETRRTMYHEAVHWFTSGFNLQPPLWFEEGLAEVLSTFYVRGDKGYWGTPYSYNLDYLATVGVQPMEAFLRSSQEQALHGTGGYYPQAWAFVHYLMFGNAGLQRPALQDFLRRTQQSDLGTAFAGAFGIAYDEMTATLARYVQGGAYASSAITVHDRGGEMVSSAATPASVELALARLALAGNNLELAEEHAAAAVGLAPIASSGYEIRALIAERRGNEADQKAALDAAIALGSKDANVFVARGWQIILESLDERAMLDQAIDKGRAREAADSFDRAIALHPRSPLAFAGLALALLNVATVTDVDDAALAAGRRVLPTDGLVLIGQAAVAKHRGNARQALGLIAGSLLEPFTLPAEQIEIVAALYNAWQSELREHVEPFRSKERDAEAESMWRTIIDSPATTDEFRRFAERELAKLLGK